MTDALTFLQSLPALQSARLESLSQFAPHLQQRMFRQGELIFKEGDTDPWLYFVEAGVCEALKRNEQMGQDVWLRDIQAFEIIGLTSAFRPKPRSATVLAKTDVQLFAIDHELFRNILLGEGSHSETLRCFFDHFAKNVRRKNKQVAALKPSKVSRGKYPVAVFDSKSYTAETFCRENSGAFDFQFFDTRLTAETASLAEGFPAVVGFVNDDLGKGTLQALHAVGVEAIALRCAGFNNVDLKVAQELGMSVTRVPAYSPHAVAEHSLALMMALNRKTHKAYQRVRDGNFRLEGLVGFDFHGQTVGVVGTGKIGKCAVHILRGLGCRVLCYDVTPDAEIQNLPGVEYCDFDTLLAQSRVISLYVPLTPDTVHLIDAEAIEKMQDGVMLINTSRGGLVETKALIDGLKSKKIGSAGLDVYEEESAYFFEDFSEKTIDDDVLARLLTFHNVMVTSHQAFLTEEALVNIARSTQDSLKEFFNGKRGQELTNAVPFG